MNRLQSLLLELSSFLYLLLLLYCYFLVRRWKLLGQRQVTRVQRFELIVEFEGACWSWELLY
jgi:hypothetical protein